MARIPRLEPTFEPADAFIGIATTIPVVQLVHFINSRTFLKLVREDDLPVYSEKAEFNYFKFFHYQDEDYRSNFCLFTNSSGGIVLFPTHRQFSYFLAVYGAIPEDKTARLVTEVKSIVGVQLAALIKQETIKNLGPVLQDLELHLTDLKKKRNETRNRIMPSAEEQ